VLLTARRLVFVAGKGGVGKTTVATALATALARDGRRTLLVSTDPAHSVADLLGRPIGDQVTAVDDRLAVVEIDAEAAADRYVERVRRDAHRAVSPEVRATVDRHLDLARRAPGTLESALVDRLADLVATCPAEHDRVVVDTAPTGHALRLLALPEVLAGWIRGLVRQRERARGVDRMLRNLAGDDAAPDDPVLRRLRDHESRLVELRTRLERDAWFVPVVLPERLPIAETERAVAALEAASLTVGPLVVNRVLPDLVEGDFLAARRAQQRDHLDDIARRFTGRTRVEVAQLARDVSDPASLAEVVSYLGPVLAVVDDTAEREARGPD
jgi:arsenite-transporting ATPase